MKNTPNKRPVTSKKLDYYQENRQIIICRTGFAIKRLRNLAKLAIVE